MENYVQSTHLFLIAFNQIQVPTPPPPARPTAKALTATRSTLPDELQLFLEWDRLTSFAELCEKISSSSVTNF